MIACSFLALFAEVVLRLLEPWPLKFVFDRIITTAPAGTPTGIAPLDRLEPLTLVAVAGLSVAVITGLRALAAYANTVGFALTGNRVLTDVRGDVYHHLQCLSLGFHSKARSGDLVIRVIGDVGVLRDVAVTALLPLVGNILIVAGMVGLMFWLNWQLTLLALATFPLFWLAVARLGRRLREASRDQRRREGAMAATAAESFGAIKIVQAYSLEGTFGRIFSGHNRRSMREGVKASRLSAGLERTVDILIAISTGLVLWKGAALVLRGALTAGDLIVFLTYLRNAFKPVRDFAKYTGRLAKASAAGERVVDLVDQPLDVQDLPGAVEAAIVEGAVRFDDVAFAYEPGRVALMGITFEARPGRRVAVVGPSGSGKSTLAGLILRLYDPERGQVTIDGRDVRQYTLSSLRSQIAIVLQDPLLFGTTIQENIAHGAPDATFAQIEEAARLANAHEFIEPLPRGYETRLGERGVTLSTGQRQRIAIARAAIRRAPILILDEPTTGLDEENVRVVVDALDRLSAGRTTILITHDLTLAAPYDLILFVEAGRIVERGTHDNLMRAGGRYATLYRLQALTGENRVPARATSAGAR